MGLSIWDSKHINRDIEMDEDERSRIEDEILREEEERKRQMQLLLWDEENRADIDTIKQDEEY